MIFKLPRAAQNALAGHIWPLGLAFDTYDIRQENQSVNIT